MESEQPSVRVTSQHDEAFREQELLHSSGLVVTSCEARSVRICRENQFDRAFHENRSVPVTTVLIVQAGHPQFDSVLSDLRPVAKHHVSNWFSIDFSDEQAAGSISDGRFFDEPPHCFRPFPRFSLAIEPLSGVAFKLSSKDVAIRKNRISKGDLGLGHGEINPATGQPCGRIASAI